MFITQTAYTNDKTSRNVDHYNYWYLEENCYKSMIDDLMEVIQVRLDQLPQQAAVTRLVVQDGHALLDPVAVHDDGYDLQG